MYSKYWMIIKDDSKRTFEVIGQTDNTNSFDNKTHAMQKLGMTVSGMTPPVSNKNSNKDAIKFVGYVKEVGLNDRLAKERMKIAMGGQEDWEG